MAVFYIKMLGTHFMRDETNEIIKHHINTTAKFMIVLSMHCKCRSMWEIFHLWCFIISTKQKIWLDFIEKGESFRMLLPLNCGNWYDRSGNSDNEARFYAYNNSIYFVVGFYHYSSTLFVQRVNNKLYEVIKFSIFFDIIHITLKWCRIEWLKMIFSSELFQFIHHQPVDEAALSMNMLQSLFLLLIFLLTSIYVLPSTFGKLIQFKFLWVSTFKPDVC